MHWGCPQVLYNQERVLNTALALSQSVMYLGLMQQLAGENAIATLLQGEEKNRR
tara:strand:- start:287 stop:448 length:162 start_codon:yes stop_codon:yes gene_type:complete